LTINELERVLQSCNPRLHIKRVASGKAGVHEGNRFLCRVDQGDITLYNQWRWDEGESQQLATPLNPKGWHRYKRLLKRGRAELARVLYTRRVISLADIAKVTWGTL
jgi:hypothetical protein